MKRSTQILLECLVAGIFLLLVAPHVPPFADSLGGGPKAREQMGLYAAENRLTIAKAATSSLGELADKVERNRSLIAKIGSSEYASFEERRDKITTHLRTHCNTVRTMPADCVEYLRDAIQRERQENARLTKVLASINAGAVERAAQERAKQEKWLAEREAFQRDREAYIAQTVKECRPYTDPVTQPHKCDLPEVKQKIAAERRPQLLRDCMQWKGSRADLVPLKCWPVMGEINTQ